MRYGGDNRGRLLIIVLIVTSLFLITLDLRGVQVIDGLRTGTQTALTPVQKAGSWAISPLRNFLSDVTSLGRTRNKIEKLQVTAREASKQSRRFRIPQVIGDSFASL